MHNNAICTIFAKNKTINLLGSLKDRTVVLNGELKRETGIAGSGYSAKVVFVPDNQSKQLGKYNSDFTSANDTLKRKTISISFVFRLFSHIGASNAAFVILWTNFCHIKLFFL